MDEKGHLEQGLCLSREWHVPAAHLLKTQHLQQEEVPATGVGSPWGAGGVQVGSSGHQVTLLLLPQS